MRDKDGVKDLNKMTQDDYIEELKLACLGIIQHAEAILPDMNDSKRVEITITMEPHCIALIRINRELIEPYSWRKEAKTFWETKMGDWQDEC